MNDDKDKRKLSLFQGVVIVFVVLMFMVFPLIIFIPTNLNGMDDLNQVYPEINDVRPDIDLNVIPRKHSDMERKAGTQNKLEVIPTPKTSTNESRHMSPPNVTYKTYCINGYVYIMFIVSYGWDPSTGTAIRIETHFKQQFDKYGRGIPCQ